MKQILLTGTLLLVAGTITACNKNETAAPTSTTTTSVATTTTTAAATTTTSIPAATQFTLTGLISDSTTNQPIPLADIEIFEGANIGRTFRADANGVYTAPTLNPGSFTMRVRAFGYPSTDVRVTITNANLRVDVPIAPNPKTTTTTTTTVPALQADFTWTPDPCTVSGGGPVADCTVDGTSTNPTVTLYSWTYGAAKTVTNNARFMLQLACTDLNGTGLDVNVNVSLTITDSTGATNSVTKNLPVKKINGACP